MAIDGEIVTGLPVPGPGRDSKYQDDFADQAFKLCLLGATDKELADFFSVSESTINRWKDQYPAFWESMRAGKVRADAEVAHSLYRRATGEHVIVEKLVKKDGVYEKVELKMFVLGEVPAQRLWLLNRNKANWRDKQDVELSGELTISAEAAKWLGR
jgi:transposase